MSVLRTIFLLLIVCNISFAQPLLNKDGLRYGNWVSEGTNPTGGNYKIIPLSAYDTLRCYFNQYDNDNEPIHGMCEVKYKLSTDYIYFKTDKKHDSISVEDGLWTGIDTTGKWEEFYDNGISLWTKQYDHKGELVQYDYTDIETDSSIYLTYQSGRIIKKEFYPPFDGNNKTTIYYPYDDLIISNAEPRFSSNFLTKPADTVAITISSKTTSTLTEFNSKLVTIWDEHFNSIQFPFKITSSPITLYFISKPNTVDCNIVETFLIKTKESPFFYEFNGLIYAAHVDASNLEQTSSITLSRSTDRYLWVKGNGSVNEVSITDQSEATKEFTIFGSRHLGIDLLDFSIGRYSLGIGMETIGNNITLIITP